MDNPIRERTSSEFFSVQAVRAKFPYMNMTILPLKVFSATLSFSPTAVQAVMGASDFVVRISNLSFLFRQPVEHVHRSNRRTRLAETAEPAVIDLRDITRAVQPG